MKKLLVLSLVLGVVSLATAGIDLKTVAGLDYTVDTATNTVTITGTDVLAFFWCVTPVGGTLSNPVNGAFANGGPGDDPALIGMFSYPEGSIVSASGSTGSAVGVDGMIYSFQYSAGTTLVNIVSETEWGLGNASIDFEGGRSVALDGYSMTIPEPMTMALLGLGGLFLRRRK